jgi:hypothetical protein
MGGSGPHIFLSRHQHIRTNPPSTLTNLSFALLHTPSHGHFYFFFLCFHMVFNNSLLFMSMSNLILNNLHFMDMTRHMLMLVDREKEWASYNMKVVIKKDQM